MSDRPSVCELVQRWQQERTLSAEQLCASCPELLEEVRQWIETLRSQEAPAGTSVQGADSTSDRVTVVKGPVAAGARPVPTIPGYEVLSELGHGGMGVVYKARQIKANRVVALKMILARQHASPEQKQRFQIEAEAVARLTHSHIVQLYEVGECDDLLFFSLEFCGGGSLDRRLKAGPLPAKAAAALIEKLARAIHYAHLQGVVHRDLKPANVLLSADGEPKISDFGLAKRLDTDGGVSQTGDLLGTPSYMAPEQAAGKTHQVGPSVDVYALGAILYELLTGRPPFRAATQFETLQQVQEQEPAPPSSLNPGTPRDLETICLKCLHKDPRRRYGSAVALADDLGHFLAGRPIQARPVGRLERSWKWVRRHPALAALAAVCAAAAGTILVGSLLFARQVQHERDWALKKQKEAEDERQHAQSAEKQAAAESVRAQQNESQALHQLRLTETSRYIGLVNLAQREMAVHNFGHARTILDGCAWDQCRFEHRYLQALNERRCQVLYGPASQDKVAVPGRTWGVVFLDRDGLRLATAGSAPTVTIWDLIRGEPVLTLQGHRGEVHGLAFHAGSRRLASAGADGTVRLWDADTGQLLRTLLGHRGAVRSVSFSPDGERLATASLDRTVKVWAVSAGQVLASSPEQQSSLYSVAFSPDGRRVLSGGGDGVKVWEAGQALAGAPLVEALALPESAGSAGSVAWSPDGHRLAAAYGNWDLKTWNALTGKYERKMDGHT
jgi:tRNA A-37 threonylcarbamoyl transferase component Bud32